MYRYLYIHAYIYDVNIYICIYVYATKPINMYTYMCTCVYHFFVQRGVFRQCQWDTSCRTRRELSNAIVKSYFRLTVVELWPFPSRNSTPSVTSLIVF